MKISYYPGCSLHSTAPEYDISTRKVCQALDVELVEIKDWICCGSTPAHQSDELMSVALPVKNMMIARDNDQLKDFCVPCSECYSRMVIAQESMKDPDMRGKVEQVVDGSYSDDFNVMHALDMIADRIGFDAVRERVVKPLKGIKLVCYYGCLITRPPSATGKRDTCELPQSMEQLMQAAGAETLDWNSRTFCCGASAALTQTDVMWNLTHKILLDAESVGADAVVVACPLCHANLDGRQDEINMAYKAGHNMPILYFTELLGLALGIDAGELGILQHLTDADALLNKLKAEA